VNFPATQTPNPQRPGVVPRARRLPLWQPLAVRDFRLVWAGEAISVLGDQFYPVALPRCRGARLVIFSLAMGTDIVDILRRAYQVEVDGETFYSMTAERAARPAVQRLFVQLAQDERQHQDYLHQVASHYRDKGHAAFKVPGSVPDRSEFTSAVFTDEVRQQAQGADFEAGVLSVGMTIETNAIAVYTDAAKTADNDHVRAFYQFLAIWERQHLIALQNAYKAVRSDFWQKSGL
jgi:rubrerythrin